jgi:hypothetical protein
MRPDNSARIILAAKRRSELTRAKAVQAIGQLERTGSVVTFESVAESAGVSRSWLYGQVDLRVEIERLRESTRKTPSSVPGPPANVRRLAPRPAAGRARPVPQAHRGERSPASAARARTRRATSLSSEGQRFEVAADVALR